MNQRESSNIPPAKTTQQSKTVQPLWSLKANHLSRSDAARTSDGKHRHNQPRRRDVQPAAAGGRFAFRRIVGGAGEVV